MEKVIKFLFNGEVDLAIISNEEFKKIDETSFDEKAKTDFLKGAKIAYESIITDFSAGKLKIT